MTTPTEHKTVHARLLKYAQEIGWTFVPCHEAERRRASGFSLRNLRSMRNLYPAYANPTICLQLVARLTKAVVKGQDAIWLQPVAKLDDKGRESNFCDRLLQKLVT